VQHVAPAGRVDQGELDARRAGAQTDDVVRQHVGAGPADLAILGGRGDVAGT